MTAADGEQCPSEISDGSGMSETAGLGAVQVAEDIGLIAFCKFS